MPITSIECKILETPLPNADQFNSKNILVLTVSKMDTKLFDFKSLKLRHTLEYSENCLTAIYIAFIPNNEQIFSCFSDDTIHIWNQNTMDSIIQFSPFKNFNNISTQKYSIDKLKIYENSSQQQTSQSSSDNVDDVIQNHHKFNRNFPIGRICTVCFTNNGEHVCLSTIDNLLVILKVENWQILKIIHYIDLRIENINYLSYSDLEYSLNNSLPGGSNISTIQKYLLIHALNGDTILIDANNVNTKTIINQANTHKLCINTKNASMFGIVLNSGEILVVKSDFFVSRIENYKRSLVYHKENRKEKSDGIMMERIFGEVSEFLFST